MEQVLININDPSWWFTGLFFVIVGIIFPKLLSAWIPRGWKYIAKLIPKITENVQRWKEKRILLTVKRYRQHQVKINWLISRYWALAILYMMYASFLGITFSLSNEIAEKVTEVGNFIPLIAPLYFFQILIVWERSVLNRTIKAHIKWQKCITRRFNAIPASPPLDSL